MKLTRFLWCSFLLLAIHSDAAINESFQWLNPLPTTNGLPTTNALPTINSLLTTAYGNGTYIAFDNYRNILECSNTTKWFVRTNISSVPNSACYGNSAFVAVGENGFILVGINGNWTTAISPTASDLNHVIFANGSFWAVGANGTILSSTDGLTWSAHLSGTTRNLYSISYGNGIFVIVSDQYTFTSADGSNWAANVDPNGFFNRVAFGNGKFFKLGYTPVMVGYPSSGTSIDGTTWNVKLTTGWYTPARLIFAQGSFVMATSNMVSYDDSGNWKASIPTPKPINDVVASDTNVFAVGDLGLIGTSTNTTNWSFFQPVILNPSCAAIAAGSNSIVAIAANGLALISTNASAFFTNSTGYSPSGVNDLIYTNGNYVVVGGNGAILKSPDGLTWTPRSTGVSASLRAISYGSAFVAVGTGGTIITSSTGDAWTGRFTGVTASLNSVTFGTGSYVAVGDGGAILTSTDSASWSGQYSTVTNNILGVAYGNGSFVAVCDNRKVLKSSDAINWVAQPQPTPAPVSRIIYDGYQFICTGCSAAFLTSLDGATWVTHTFNIASNLRGICPTSGGLLFCGDNGAIIQSGPAREPRITSPIFSSFPFTLNIQGEINHVYTLQTSTDLTTWTSLFAFTNTSSVTQVSDSSLPPDSARFYRVLSPAAP